MKTDISKQADYISRAVDFRSHIFDGLESRDPDQLWLKASIKDVQRIIVIAAASRSGSSLLFSILKKIPCVYSLSGESVPFYKLNGLSGDFLLSDQIQKEVFAQEDEFDDLSRDFLSDFSFAEAESGIIKEKNILDRYIDDLVLRFALQWPALDFSYEVFTRLAAQAYELYVKEHKVFCVKEFYLELIFLLRRDYDVINPYYYDIPAEMIREKFPTLEIPSGPANSILAIEEAPFILLSPRRKLQKEDLFDKTLLLKSTADCYRLPFLETMFPNAEIKIVYLTRNSLGSINGLYDGWLHRGFFSHNLSGILKNNNKALEISGYSDRYEWGKCWWNCDLPPGWQEYTHKRLEEVCAFQWYSANDAVQQYLRKTKKEYCLVRYENIIGSPASRAVEIDKIINFTGLNAGAIRHLDLHTLPVVQATEPPRAYRWKNRENMLLPFLDDPKLAGMSVGLGYRKDNIQEWF